MTPPSGFLMGLRCAPAHFSDSARSYNQNRYTCQEVCAYMVKSRGEEGGK